jgi:hypothetical protein
LAGGQHPQARTGVQQGQRGPGGGRGDVLAVVQHDQHVASGQRRRRAGQVVVALGRRARGRTGTHAGAHRRGDGGVHRVGAPSGQVDDDHAVGVGLRLARTHVDREGGLAHPARPHHGDQPCGAQPPDHRGVLVLAAHQPGERRRRRAGRGLPAGRVEGRVLEQDGGLQPLQLGAGIEARALDQRGRGLAVGAQGVGLPPGPGQRGHEQRPAPLAQRLVVDQAAQQGQRPIEPAVLHQRLGQLLLGVAPLVLEGSGFGPQQRIGAQLAQGVARPQVEGGGE